MFKQYNGSILVVGAHPDDAELMAGGFISRAVSQGATVYSVVVSDGCENGDIGIRQKETLKAAKIIGIREVFFCGVRDGRVPHDIEMVKTIDDYINRIEPSIIITHSSNDTHQDHRNVCNTVMSATRRNPNIVLQGETPSSFMGNNNLIHINVTDFFKYKIKSLRAYKSQIKSGPVDIQKAKLIASYRGQKVNTRYAEAFKVWRFLI